MKALYWRPSRVSRLELLLMALLAGLCLLVCETTLVRRQLPHRHAKLAASLLTQRACEALAGERRQRGRMGDPQLDPAGSGLIGSAASPLTTSRGMLDAKQTALNVNFAAVVLSYLKTINIQPGDRVAVGMSGSFPVLNIATLAALQVLQAQPLVIVSVAASQYGANDPNFTWPDMLQVLQQRAILTPATATILAASRGGIDDRALALGPEGIAQLDAAMRRHRLTPLQVRNLADSLDQRMQIYQQAAAGAPIRAYVNVGGGATSVGTHVGKHVFAPGLTTHLAPGTPIVDSVMQRFAGAGVPVIHLSSINRLAQQHGLPLAPPQLPPVGAGGIYAKPAYSRLLAGLSLVAIVGTMVAFLRFDVGQRLRRGAGR